MVAIVVRENAPASAGVWAWLTRGYTSHEHLRPFALINMNGRLYDPALGRMLSVDNYVVGSSETQAYNRYTYAFNNPMVYNDPDGNHPIAIAFMIGIFVNIAQHIIQGTVPDNMWEFLKPGVISAATAALGPVFSVAGKYAASILASNSSPFVQSLIANSISTALSSTFSMGISGGNMGRGFLQGLATGSVTSLVSLNKTNPTGSPSQVASVVDEFDPKSIPGTWLNPVIVKASKEGTPQIWSYLSSKRYWKNYFDYPKHIADAAQWMVLDVFGGSMMSAVPIGAVFRGGLTTQAGCRVFWSGTGARAAAEEFARAEGMKTLEMTLQGKVLTRLHSVIPEKQMYKLGDHASASFARRARGSVTVFHSLEGVSTTSTWTRIEYPILKQNKILIHWKP